MKLIKIGKPNCTPCLLVDQYFSSQNIPLSTINVEKDLDAAVQYQVMSVPVTLLLTDEGSEIMRVRGFEPEQLDELVGQYRLREQM